MPASQIAVLVVVVLTLAVVKSGKVHRPAAALAGGLLCLGIGGLAADRPSVPADFQAFTLIIAMGVLAELVRRSGFFQWAVVKGAKAAGGRPRAILVLVALLSACSAALVGAGATVAMFGPVLILVSVELAISPIPFLLALAVSANIGGMAALTGDPSLMVVASAGGLGFADFLRNNGLAALAALAAALAVLRLLFAKLDAPRERRARVLEFDESRSIENRPLMVRSLAVLAAVALCMAAGGWVGVKPAYVAFAGALALFLLSRQGEPDALVKRIDWSGVLSLAGFYCMSAGAVQTGLPAAAAPLAAADPAAVSLAALWTVGLAAMVFDRLALAALVVPFAQAAAPGLGASPVWWALALGLAIGGSASLDPSSPGGVVAEIAAGTGQGWDRRRLARAGRALALAGLAAASAYIVLRYFVWRF